MPRRTVQTEKRTLQKFSNRRYGALQIF
uniref:Uncharacterized protein n=1 Tax=Romanomermis culicivorax TaxID=13658 RepID=A0A915IH26_ROMCU